MDIRSSLAPLLLALALCSVASARSGNRRYPRRQHRRAIGEYLAPPALNAPTSDYGLRFPGPPRRPARFLGPPTTESPGYFARLASWLNPFGGSPTPPPLPEISFAPKHPQTQPTESSAHDSSYPPPPTSYERYDPSSFPQPPPAGPAGYLPPRYSTNNRKNCNPCDKVPWLPLPVLAKEIYSHSADSDREPPGHHPALAEVYALPPQEAKPTDFTYGPPVLITGDKSSASHRPYSRPVLNLPPPPVPNPHLYPGPMPPLFKAKPFHVAPSEVPQHLPGAASGPGNTEYVEVLPPGAEVESVPVSAPNSPPSGYGPPHPPREEVLTGFSGTNYSPWSSAEAQPEVRQSETVYEEHTHHVAPTSDAKGAATTNTWTGEKVSEGASNASPDRFPPNVEHPISYEESPLIDLSVPSQGHEETSHGIREEHPAGLNPPPDEPANSYAPSQPSTADPSPNSHQLAISNDGLTRDSYGSPLDASRDSQVASSANNVTVYEPAVTNVSPNVNDITVNVETLRSTSYQTQSSGEKDFPATVAGTAWVDAKKNVAPSFNGLPIDPGRVNQELLEHYTSNDDGEIDHRDTGVQQSSQQNTPAGSAAETLIPYRPSSLYVPYPPYPAVSVTTESSTSSTPTTEEPFLEALMKSYSNFQKEMETTLKYDEETDNGKLSQGEGSWPVPFRSDVSSGHQMNAPAGVPPRYQETKRNKQVQIIIPYTSQHTPSPFQPASDGDWSGRGILDQNQARKAPDEEPIYRQHVPQESRKFEVTAKPLDAPLIREINRLPSVKTNNSIDVLRLQKNIDNWTIQEYLTGATASTALPSSPHPHLLPSKKIPEEYLTTARSISPAEEKRDDGAGLLSGFSFNDLEHEGSASSRVEVPHVQIVSFERATKPTVAEAPTTERDGAASSTTDASWRSLPVSISPHDQERVYVVTPQSPVRDETPKSSEPKKATAETLKKTPKTSKFEHIERAYQVLPQAVNNLATTSTTSAGSESLWGGMAHEELARLVATSEANVAPVITYSGHSKVSNARQ